MEKCVQLPALGWEILPKLVAEHDSRSERNKEQIMELTSDSASLTLGLERTKAEAAEAEARLQAAKEEVVVT